MTKLVASYNNYSYYKHTLLLSLSSSLSHTHTEQSFRNIFKQAMEVWSEHTCIQFVPALTEPDRIVFIDNDYLG